MTVQKRLFDLALALLLLVPLGIVMAVVTLALLVGQGRPVLYGAERMHAPGHPFTLWKFRTMRPATGDSGVSGGDKAARITGPGRFLRRTRLDELPQLFNILRGDMSFVGPRPPLRQYVEAFPALYAEVLACRPGVTGLATLVFHRHEERILASSASSEDTNRVYMRRCIPRKARLDLIYRRRQSLCLDLAILLRTLAAVARRS
ncbi:MAG: sugar transferase [Albidovulum sp.]|uniref:sugar transferase n=1 Tax=Albidovulum sp. TaxID=1872424 RepID=UPI001321C998|nr:sugar transferase [Defluviimonas sp.]KAB2883450.1 MAG: sugar transferase [Defluviimonas sp.]